MVGDLTGVCKVKCAIEQCAMCNGSLCIIPRSILSPRPNLGLGGDGANNAPPKRHPPGETISNDPVLKLVEANLKTLPKALRTQALTALTSNFGLVGLVQSAW